MVISCNSSWYTSSCTFFLNIISFIKRNYLRHYTSPKNLFLLYLYCNQLYCSTNPNPAQQFKSNFWNNFRRVLRSYDQVPKITGNRNDQPLSNVVHSNPTQQFYRQLFIWKAAVTQISKIFFFVGIFAQLLSIMRQSLSAICQLVCFLHSIISQPQVCPSILVLAKNKITNNECFLNLWTEFRVPNHGKSNKNPCQVYFKTLQQNTGLLVALGVCKGSRRRERLVTILSSINVVNRCKHQKLKEIVLKTRYLRMYFTHQIAAFSNINWGWNLWLLDSLITEEVNFQPTFIQRIITCDETWVCEFVM